MSDTPVRVEVNCETGEVTTRPLTAEEIAIQAADLAQLEAEKAAAETEAVAKAAAKASAEAKLASLGLTAEEVAALTK